MALTYLNAVLLSLAVMQYQSPFAESALYWTQLLPATSTRPSPRQYSGLAWTSEAVYAFGGQSANGPLNDMWKFSLHSNSWSEVELDDFRPSPRYGFISGMLNEYWYIIQGRHDDGVLDDVWAFHLTTEKWHLVNTSLDSFPLPRYFAAGGSNPVLLSPNSSNGSLWISMGISRTSRKLSDTWKLTINFSSPLEGVWTKLSDGVGLNQYDPRLPHARGQAAGMPFGDDRFLITGGCASGGQVGGPCPMDDSWMYSHDSWSSLSSCSPPVHSASIVPFNSQWPEIGILYGGTQDGPGPVNQILSDTSPKGNEISLINVTSMNWIRIHFNSSYPPLRSGAQMTMGVRGVYLFGGKNSANGSYRNDLWLLQGNGADIQVVPCPSAWFSFVHLHGILMYLAWGILLPFGALIGRYFKFQKIWPAWFAVHLICQIGGTLLTGAGFIMIFLVSTQPSFPHGVIGIVLTFTLFQQFLSGFIRPWIPKENPSLPFTNKESFKYKWRQCWLLYHRVSGIITVGLGFIQVTLGVFLLGAPLVVWIVWVLLLLLWLLVFGVLEIIYWTCIKNNNSKE